LLKNFVKNQIQQILVNANTAIHAQHPNISVSLVGDVTFHSPYRIPTDSLNRPNQYYVKLPMNFKINVSIPYTSDRQLYYPLDLNVTCDKWYTGNGTVTVTAVTGPPDIQGGNIIENLLMVRDLIDAKVKASLPQIGSITQSLGGLRCVRIGASPSTGHPDPLDAIIYDKPSGRVIAGGAALAFPRVTVTYLRLKRLQARGNGGGVLYSPTENIRLDTYANYSEEQSQVLTMNEGDDVALTMPPVVFTPPYSDTLVIIANVQQQQNGYTEDSAWGPALRNANFSPGTHTITISKTYVIPGGPGHVKPTFGHAPAYELTYKVDFVDRPNLQIQPTTTRATTQ
jgi:hypothetical protein